jgi:hypothetical protein
MLLGGLWKLLTLGASGTYTTEHLTVLTSAIVGTLGFYRAAVLVLGARRWMAAGFALLYLFTPSWLSMCYKADAYMSYMAFAAMPLVLFGNARTLHKPDGKGYATLAAGLALIWMCHPPIALLTITATLFIQAAAVVEQGLASWKSAMASAVIFALLSAYYFCSMSELPARPTGGASLGSSVVLLVGIALFALGVGRAVFAPGRLAWLAGAAGGLAIVAHYSRPWTIWAAFTGAFILCAALAVRKTRWVHSERNAFIVIFFCGLAGAASAEAFLGKGYSAINGGTVSALASNMGQISEFLRPLGTEMDTAAVFQTGWSVMAALFLAVAGMFVAGPTGPKVFAAAAFTLAICFIRVPLVSNFLVGYYPQALAGISGLPLALRVTPVLSSFSIMAAVLWFGARRTEARWQSNVAAGTMIVAIAWSAFQTSLFVRIGYKVTSSEAATAQSLRPENVMLDRYAYDLLHIPDYYSNGVTDPAMESRLLGADGSVLVGPMENAAEMEKAGAEKIRLVGKPVENSESWMDIVPKITIPPGAHKVLRYEFDGTQNYSGYMMFFSEHSYREYHLPDSGQPEAFGIGGKRTSVLTFWNTGDSPEHYRVLINREPGDNLKENGGFFANLTVSNLDPASLPISLHSLDPYHVTVRARQGVTLETFRIFLPGYRGYVDGVEVPLSRSKNALLEVQVPAGVHDVVVRFVGTLRLWTSAVVSSVSWIVLLACWVATRRRNSAAF